MHTYKRVVYSLVASVIVIGIAVFITSKVKKPTTKAPEDVVVFLHSDSAFDQIASSKGLAVVDFFADWCGACQTMMPVYHEVAHDMKKSANSDLRNITFYAANVDELKKASNDLGIQGIPSFAFYKDGKLLGVESGYKPKDAFISLVKSKFELR
jgi:thioredoxin 1